jgi:hypothetical protein
MVKTRSSDQVLWTIITHDPVMFEKDQGYFLQSRFPTQASP